MIEPLIFPTQNQLNLLTTVATVSAPTFALLIYFHRRYTRRKRIAGALIKEIQENRKWAYGQQPHYDQHNIVGLSETFVYDFQGGGAEGEEGHPFTGSIAPTGVRVPNYESGDIPPSARASSTVYKSTASDISRFNQDLAEKLAEYYHQLHFVKELNDTIHEGRELPPAAYSVLADNVDEYLIENEDLERKLEIEMRRFPQTYRWTVTVAESLANKRNKIISPLFNFPEE